MNFIIAYFKGIWQVLKSGKMIAVHYLTLLILALLSALPLMNLMEAKFGRSLAIEKLMPDFDYTVFQDFKNMPGVGDAFSAIGNTSVYLLLLFFILSVFLTGGVLEVYKNAPAKFTLRSFFSGCTYYFWRLLRMTVYFMVVHALVAGLFVFIYRQLVDGGFAVLENEIGYLDVLKKVGIAYLLVGSLFFMVQDYAKIHMVHRDEGFVFNAFWGAFPLAFRSFFNTFLLYVLNALTFVGVVALYLFLSRFVMEDTLSGIGLALLLGQAFIIARIAVRLLNLSSATLIYKGIMKKRNAKQLAIEEAEQIRLKAIADAEAKAEEARLLAEEASAEANIASEKARMAAQVASSIAVSNIASTAKDQTTAVDTPTPDLTIPPAEPDALKVVPPPPISRADFEEEE